MINCIVNKLNPKKAYLNNSDIVKIESFKCKYNKVSKEYDLLKESLLSVRCYTDILNLKYKIIDTNDDSLGKIPIPNPCIGKGKGCDECIHIKSTLLEWESKSRGITYLYNHAVSVLDSIKDYYNNECLDSKKGPINTDLFFVKFGIFNNNGYELIHAVAWNCMPLKYAEQFSTEGIDLYVFYNQLKKFDCKIYNKSSMSMLYHLNTSSYIELCDFDIEEEHLGHGQFALDSFNNAILYVNSLSDKHDITPITYVQGIIRPKVDTDDPNEYKEKYNRLVKLYKFKGYLGESRTGYKFYKSFE